MANKAYNTRRVLLYNIFFLYSRTANNIILYEMRVMRVVSDFIAIRNKKNDREFIIYACAVFYNALYTILIRGSVL